MESIEGLREQFEAANRVLDNMCLDDTSNAEMFAILDAVRNASLLLAKVERLSGRKAMILAGFKKSCEEINRLAAERDAAVSKAEALELSNEVLEHDLIDAAITPCTYCKHDPSNGGNCDCINEHHDMFSCWEWRGAEGKGDRA